MKLANWTSTVFKNGEDLWRWPRLLTNKIVVPTEEKKRHLRKMNLNSKYYRTEIILIIYSEFLSLFGTKLQHPQHRAHWKLGGIPNLPQSVGCARFVFKATD